MESIEKQDPKTPFKKPLIKSRFPSYDLKDLPDAPNKTVRVEVLEDFAGFWGISDPEKAAKRGLEEFKKLEEKYNINVAPMNLVIGEDKDGYATAYTVTDVIKGKENNLSEFTISNYEIKEREKIKKQLELLFLSLLEYLKDAYNSGGYHFMDIYRSDQYVYGKRKDELKNKIWLVDVEQKHINHVRARKANFNFLKCLKSLSGMMVGTEGSYNGERLEKVNAELANFISLLEKNDDYSQNNANGLIDEIKINLKYHDKK